MSIDPTTDNKKRTPAAIALRKGGEPIVCLTAYSAPMASLLDPVADLLLVGDSLGMAVYGFDSTLPVTMEMMIAHGAAAVRGAKRACVIVDMPFGSYQESPAQAFKGAARIMAETGAAGIKLEGGEAMAATIRFLVERGIPVLGHIGLQPQSVNVIGGFRAQGRNEVEAARVMAASPKRSIFRPSASAPRRPATGRSWSPRTSSAWPGSTRRASSSAMPSLARRSRKQQCNMPPRCATGVSRVPSIATVRRRSGPSPDKPVPARHRSGNKLS